MARQFLVTDNQIAQYQRDGAVLLKAVLPSEIRRRLEVGVEEAFNAIGGGVTAVTGAAGDGKTVVRDYASNDSPGLREVIECGLFGQIAAELMQTTSAQLILDQIFYKMKGPILPTPWHQDTPFLRVRGDELVRLWSPCDRSSRDLTVQVVRGSHRWNVVYNTTGKPATGRRDSMGMQDGDPGVGDPWLPPAPDVRRHRDSFDILTWDVEPGDVLAFQGNMLHGTDGHAGHDRPRRALAVLLGGPDLRYHKPWGKAFPSPERFRGARPNDDIPDGAPIGDHAAAFPILWQMPAQEYA